MIINLNENIIKKLTKTEYEIVKFINNNQKILQDLSIVDIAFETFSSPATVSRAIRKCGINGFNELRYKLGRWAWKWPALPVPQQPWPCSTTR